MSRLRLVLFGLLILAAGFAGGWATHRNQVLNRMHEVARMRKASGFETSLYRRIEATPAQREELDPIVQRYGVLIDSLHHQFGRDRRTIVKEMHEEIKPFLSEDQIDKLGRFSRRFEFREGHLRKKKKWD